MPLLSGSCHCGAHWVVNLRCVDGLDLSARVIAHFDGEHWEAAARAFLSRRTVQSGPS